MSDIPLIDIGPLRHTGVDANGLAITAIEAACRDVGFMYVAGHGIDNTRIEAIRDAAIGYFARPLDDKLRDRITRGNYRGYIPQGFFTPNAGDGPADRYEGYKLHFEVDADDPIRGECDLYGPNRWPRAPRGFRAAVQDYWRACDAVTRVLLDVFATILGVDRRWFSGLFVNPLTNMTLLHYPAPGEDRTGFGIHPHKDTDVVTLLVADDAGGLMIRPKGAREWHEARPPPGTLVVNIGDLLERWSGGYLVSTPHKVENRGGAERYSFPYFVVPRFDTIVEPLREPVNGFSRNRVHVGDVSREVWRTNWPDAAPRDPALDLGTLAD